MSELPLKEDMCATTVVGYVSNIDGWWHSIVDSMSQRSDLWLMFLCVTACNSSWSECRVQLALWIHYVVSGLMELCVTACNGCWSAHRVELALWTHYVACELKPELLDGMPNGTIHHQNGDSQSSPATEALSIPADETTTVWIITYHTAPHCFVAILF